MNEHTLSKLAVEYSNFSIYQSFVTDAKRAERFSVAAAGLFLDYSKQKVTCEIMDQLEQWAQRLGLSAKISAMFNGDKINFTEERAVLHTVLRAPYERQEAILGEALANEVANTELKMETLIQAINDKSMTGYSGLAFTDIVAVGIGGSYYGPKICDKALTPYQSKGLSVHYVANVDGNALESKLQLLNPQTTLVVVISKTFTTQETLLNANALKSWLVESGCGEYLIHKHFVAVTTNLELAVRFGVDPDNILPMWDWVGGRFSLWSAVGFPLACAIGVENFKRLKAGAYEMDKHLLEAPLSSNMPVILALLGVWNRSFLNYPSLAVLPYDHLLGDFPGYLQQLDMESNGKQVTVDGDEAPLATAPIVFGQEGTNGQHAFMQLMHQSDEVVPTEFIVALRGHSRFPEHHQTLVANCFAQSETLMQGKSLVQVQEELAKQGMSSADIAQLAPHKVMKGNVPSVTLTMEQLTPETMGSLMALYEHKIFVQGVMWQLNSFDQWGVELGKVLGQRVMAAMSGNPDAGLSASSQQLINRFNQVNKNDVKKQ
ncbi:glucose-6-phosphate isomerase [Psychrobium sp. 1_MG-2023]|uniref:glucose-6-phosphate isomerase n=1 Tax=Psychrobium sp. 1_MG-2023 TaxID=3062624 RepID=UPI00273603F0|nr:glucose-6-phosphate isomerase [Psychrobium sp. 1_MG-2023]MDP2561110.1 glucose-6-phosphate isomerase [Psychrobium sp. 1_MG-2023]